MLENTKQGAVELGAIELSSLCYFSVEHFFEFAMPAPLEPSQKQGVLDTL